MTLQPNMSTNHKKSKRKSRRSMSIERVTSLRAHKSKSPGSQIGRFSKSVKYSNNMKLKGSLTEGVSMSASMNNNTKTPSFSKFEMVTPNMNNRSNIRMLQANSTNDDLRSVFVEGEDIGINHSTTDDAPEYFLNLGVNPENSGVQHQYPEEENSLLLTGGDINNNNIDNIGPISSSHQATPYESKMNTIPHSTMLVECDWDAGYANKNNSYLVSPFSQASEDLDGDINNININNNNNIIGVLNKKNVENMTPIPTTQPIIEKPQPPDKLLSIPKTPKSPKITQPPSSKYNIPNNPILPPRHTRGIKSFGRSSSNNGSEGKVEG